MKRNELCNLLVSATKKELDKWQRKHPETPLLDLVQQINLAALELKTMGSRTEELYKKGLTGKQYYGKD